MIRRPATFLPSLSPFVALYVSRFAGGFGFIILATLLPKYIEVLDPSAVTVVGLTLSAGVVIGLFTTGFTLSSGLAVVPIAWWGDRGDKRRVLVAALALGIVVYAAYPLVETSLGFVLLRVVQGLTFVGISLMSLGLVGQLATTGTRANYIGKANAWAFAASIVGSLSAGILYDRYGFGPVFTVVTAVFVVATALVWVALPGDDTVVDGFPFSDLALNRRILTVATFRTQYAVAVTLVRTWVPIFAGVSAATGGLAYGGLAVSLTVVAEKFTNMLSQPTMGRLSDRYGRAAFVAAGGTGYGVVAVAVPFAPSVGASLGLPATLPLLGPLSPAFLPLVALSGLLGVADSLREPASMALFADEGTDSGGVASSFGVRDLLWRPGSIAGPLLGGWLMTEVGMGWVFYVGGAFALTGVAAFLATLVVLHGPNALSEW
ncbi:MFS transporter [Salinigranum salinum]|uniref:MFS transporter n=1 Tax=Salinigranum salinum TaxID=1364937 RepID=UPI001F035DC8|nr:MFS transporter [Salinigranum salinum]